MKSLIKTQRKKRNYTGWILLLGETTAGKTAGAQRSGIKYSSKSTSPLWKIKIISIMSSLCSSEFSICISQLLSVQRALSDSPCQLFFPPHTQTDSTPSRARQSKQSLHSMRKWCCMLLFPLKLTNRLQQMAAPLWAWFRQRSLPDYQRRGLLCRRSLLRHIVQFTKQEL